MMTETALKVEAADMLIKTFGVLDTERFITNIKNNSFDYTAWHKNLWKGKTFDEIHKMATELEHRKNK